MPSQESKFKFCFQTLKYIIEHIYTRYLVQKMLELPTKTPKKKNPKEPQNYNFGPCVLFSCFSSSLSNRRRILPLGLLGITSINSTPPFSHLCLALCSSTCLRIAATTSSSETLAASLALVTYALGTSPARSSGTGMTAQSETNSWERRWASSSAGATWLPCCFSQRKVTMRRASFGYPKDIP